MTHPQTTRSWLIADPGAEAGAIETLPETPNLKLLTRDELRASDLHFGRNDKVCITSEAVIEDVLDRLEDDRLRAGISTMKDKVAFREALNPLFPSFWFEQVGIDQLASRKLDPRRSYVIKPVKGCFGSGVRVIQGDVDLKQLGVEISMELERNSGVFSDSVLSSADLIIEECIRGEEYAVDMFYDREGKPVITNIYYHPMPRNPAYLHMIYCTSWEIFSSIHDKAIRFFESFRDAVPLRNLPIHAEFRLQGDQLVPIEMNSLRFGGMGLTNLSYYAFGSNAYQYFIDDAAPEWETIWKQRPKTTYAFFIAYNGERTDLLTHEPDWDSFREIFSNILYEVAFDYRKQLAFGILYVEGMSDQILELLNTEFDDYFVPIGADPNQEPRLGR